MIKKALIGLTLLLAGCTGTPRFEKFCEIAKDYEAGKHDCDDMTQEFRDYLIKTGTKKEDIKLILGRNYYNPNSAGHAWLELKEGDNWRAYDATQGAFGFDISRAEITRGRIEVIKELEGKTIINDGSGYGN